jgi:hypothetical protein
MMLRYFPVVLLLLLSVAACKKKETTPEAVSKATLLADKNWRLTGATLNPPVVLIITVSDAYPYLESCQKDDLYKFKTDKTLSVEEGVIKCNTQSPVVKGTGTWSLNADETVLTFIYNNNTITGKLTQISDQTMVMETNAATLANTLGLNLPVAIPSNVIATVTFTNP